jgi:hypothetical protein
MIINKIDKVKISAGFINGYKGHELEIWFDDMDTTKRGFITYACVDHLKLKGIIKRGYGFKASEEYYNTEEGKQWLIEHINNRYKMTSKR